MRANQMNEVDAGTGAPAATGPAAANGDDLRDGNWKKKTKKFKGKKRDVDAEEWRRYFPLQQNAVKLGNIIFFKTIKPSETRKKKPTLPFQSQKHLLN